MAKIDKKKLAQKQWLFFYLILQSSMKESEISQTELYGPITSCWFHHIYPKSKYPELRFCIENIILVTKEEHDQIEAGVVFKEVEQKKKYIAEHYDELLESTNAYLKEFLDPVFEHALKTNFFKKH